MEATVGNKSAIVGIITKIDIVRRYPSLSRKRYKVADFMASNVYTVVPSALLHEAMLLMVNGNISRIVVIEKRKPVGIITMHDLLPIGILSTLFSTGSKRMISRWHLHLQSLYLFHQRKG